MTDINTLIAEMRRVMDQAHIGHRVLCSSDNIAALLDEIERLRQERDDAREWSRLRDADIIRLGQEVGALKEPPND
jgi:hypothetical protein